MEEVIYADKVIVMDDGKIVMQIFVHADCPQTFLYTLPDLFCRHAKIFWSKANILLNYRRNNLTEKLPDGCAAGNRACIQAKTGRNAVAGWDTFDQGIC